MNFYFFNPLASAFQQTLHTVNLLLHLDQPGMVNSGARLALKIILIKLMRYEVILLHGQTLLSD